MNHPSSLRAAALAAGSIAALAAAQAEPIRIGNVHPAAAPAAPAAASASWTNVPPLEGALYQVVLSVTDAGLPVDDIDFNVYPAAPPIGNALPNAESAFALGILDSGAATTIFDWPEADAMGLQGDALTGFTFPVSGTGGATDFEVSYPVGIFAHGVQQLTGGGAAQSGLMVGQWNFPCLANTEANYLGGKSLFTLLGAPFFTMYPVEIRNSELHEIAYRGETVRTAAVEFFDGPVDPGLPSYPHRAILEYIPAGTSAVSYFAFPDFINGGFTLIFPAVIGGVAGSLYQTASENLRLHHNNDFITVKMVVDTAAQATLISEVVASDLGYNLDDPAFTVDVAGAGGTTTAPGIYLDAITLPTSAGGITWSNVPAVVINAQGPDGTTLDGILGNNLFGNRDFLFNGAATPPYIDISDVVIPPAPTVTAIRLGTNGTIEIDWDSVPAPPSVVLEQAPAPDGPWSAVATGELPTVTGSLSITGASPSAVFRWTSP